MTLSKRLSPGNVPVTSVLISLSLVYTIWFSIVACDGLQKKNSSFPKPGTLPCFPQLPQTTRLSLEFSTTSDSPGSCPQGSQKPTCRTGPKLCLTITSCYCASPLRSNVPPWGSSQLKAEPRSHFLPHLQIWTHGRRVRKCEECLGRVF